jgi:NAD(P)H-flavin reductase/hemoglobin-like flavoprotein
MTVDTDRLKDSFAEVARNGDEVPLFFYSYLFLRHPSTRAMFPPSMAAQRDRLVSALAGIVANVDQLATVVPFVEQLGRDHRKFDVAPEHYPAVGEALIATLRHFLGDRWTSELATDWAAAFAIVSDVMIKAADDAEGSTPARWHGQIVEHDRRRPDVAVIRVAPEIPVPYLAGQSLSVHTAHRPRLWRFYSPANAPRADGGIELHVRAVDGGWVSSALVAVAGVGDILEFGSPVGALHLEPHSDADLLMIAGGTGLAPLTAIAEDALTRDAVPRRVHLFHEAASEADLYDTAHLDWLADRHPEFQVTLVARNGAVRRAVPGTAVDAALRQSRWAGHDVYVCGSEEMTVTTMDTLLRAGLDPRRLHTESFGYRTGADSMHAASGGSPR